MNRQFSISRQQGQSLVEVLIAIMVVTIVLTTVVVAVIMSVKSAKFSQHKTRGTFLSQEAIEWARGQKNNLGWGDFSDLSSAGGSLYCLYTLAFTSPGTCGPTELIDGLYNRSATLTFNEIQQMVEVSVLTTWYEGEKEFNAQVSAQFTNWDYQN